MKSFPMFLAAVSLMVTGLFFTPNKGVASQLAQPGEAAQAKIRINLAGRQRMLTQRMARQICAAGAGIEVETNRDAARDTAQIFAQVLAQLRDGGGEEGLSPETNQRVLEELSQVAILWEPYSAAIRSLSDEEPGADIDQVRQLNSAVLAAMNAAVNAMEEASGSTLSPDLAKTINVAGRQRMLTERALMWACLSTTGTGGQGDAEKVRAAQTLFSSSLAALRVGDEGVIAPPTWEIDAQLEVVADLWGNLAPWLDRMAAGAPTKASELAQMIDQGVLIVDAMNDAVWMYENF